MRLPLLLVLLCLLAACGGPQATPTPAFARHAPADVARVLGPLGATDFREHRRAATSVGPHTETDQRDFTIPGVAPKGGQALFFASAADVAEMQAWLGRFPAISGYVYAHGNVILQIDGGVPFAEAERYRAALVSLP